MLLGLTLDASCLSTTLGSFFFRCAFALGDDLQEDMADSAEASEVSREGLYDRISALRLNNLCQYASFF